MHELIDENTCHVTPFRLLMFKQPIFKKSGWPVFEIDSLTCFFENALDVPSWIRLTIPRDASESALHTEQIANHGRGIRYHYQKNGHSMYQWFPGGSLVHAEKKNFCQVTQAQLSSAPWLRFRETATLSLASRRSGRTCHRSTLTTPTWRS